MDAREARGAPGALGLAGCAAEPAGGLGEGVRLAFLHDVRWNARDRHVSDLDGVSVEARVVGLLARDEFALVPFHLLLRRPDLLLQVLDQGLQRADLLQVLRARLAVRDLLVQGRDLARERLQLVVLLLQPERVQVFKLLLALGTLVAQLLQVVAVQLLELGDVLDVLLRQLLHLRLELLLHEFDLVLALRDLPVLLLQLRAQLCDPRVPALQLLLESPELVLARLELGLQRLPLLLEAPLLVVRLARLLVRLQVQLLDLLLQLADERDLLAELSPDVVDLGLLVLDLLPELLDELLVGLLLGVQLLVQVGNVLLLRVELVLEVLLRAGPQLGELALQVLNSVFRLLLLVLKSRDFLCFLCQLLCEFLDLLVERGRLDRTAPHFGGEPLVILGGLQQLRLVLAQLFLELALLLRQLQPHGLCLGLLLVDMFPELRELCVLLAELLVFLFELFCEGLFSLQVFLVSGLDVALGPRDQGGLDGTEVERSEFGRNPLPEVYHVGDELGHLRCDLASCLGGHVSARLLCVSLGLELLLELRYRGVQLRLLLRAVLLRQLHGLLLLVHLLLQELDLRP